MKESVVRDGNFSEAGDVRLDSKYRLCLPKGLRTSGVHAYRVYSNDAGQIVLDPQVVIPAAEAWLFKNKSALDSVRRGLQELAEGKVVRKSSLAKHSKDQIE